MVIPQTATQALQAVLDGTPARDLEGQRLEFKADNPRSAQDSVRTVAEAVACLANAQGGVVVVGVDDRRLGAQAVVGTRLEVDATRRRIFELTDPPLVVGVEAVDVAGATVLVIAVAPSPTVHAVGGRCTERIADACAPMSPERIATVIADRRGEDWSIQPSGVPVADADPVAVSLARTMLTQIADPGRLRLADRSDRDLLRGLGVATGPMLTNAGALLFTDRLAGSGVEPEEVLAYAYRRTPSGALVVNEHLSGPLLPALHTVFDLVEARLDRTSVNLARGQQLQVADLPEAAVREALVNAVMHRDYRRPGPVLAEHSPARFAVTSPGPFLTGITPDNVLTTSSRTRNPHLANVIRALGLAETAGTGVDRMVAAMTRFGHHPPRFTADPDRVRVILAGGVPNSHLARYAATLPAGETQDADTMLVLFTLLTRPTVTASQAAPLLQRDEVEAHAVLERLAAPPIDMLEPTRETVRRARPTYRLRSDVVAALGPAVTYRHRARDDDERKIVAMVRESGTVTSKMLQIMLDLNGVAASRLLADLVTREILTRTSASTRGPGVTYGPGPAFPAAKGRRER